MKKIYLIWALSFLVFFVGLDRAASAQVLYRLPLSSNPGIGSWFDHDTRAGFLLRYDGTTNFYYDDHHGLDVPTWRGRPIYAGASGSLYYRVDGCPEPGDADYNPQSSPNCGGYYGNHVRLQHGDNHVTIYAHMKRSSAAWYMSLLCGANVGQVGNSGLSSASHLHFELWASPSIGQRLDFFGGRPNNYVSYWTTYNSPNLRCQ